MKRKLTYTNYFIILEKKRFSRKHTKHPNANVGALQDVTFWAVEYHYPHPGSQLAYHICYVKYEKTPPLQKDKLGGDVIKIFFICLYVKYKM